MLLTGMRNISEYPGCWVKMKPEILAVIPARYGSRRFPGKPLAQIAGKSLLEHIYEEVSKSKLISRVVVATDSQEIYRAVENFGGEPVFTSARHHTGSDRVAEIGRKLGGEIIINIQADHLGVKGSDYDRILKIMITDRKIEYATIAKRVENEEQLYDPNRVKVLIDGDNNAIWFSRYPLPYLQGVDDDRLKHFDFHYHIGVYFFRKKALLKFQSRAQSRYEKAESLEQLRILENHHKIRVFKIKSGVYSIDTPEDLKPLENIVL
jgi:3-deoxy-manno-octulosonate cytidylyltransferase (CMP-KDO synthetase)